jgi:heme/copper-type cytochrome/quinol oxidase subunit 3
MMFFSASTYKDVRTMTVFCATNVALTLLALLRISYKTTFSIHQLNQGIDRRTYFYWMNLTTALTIIFTIVNTVQLRPYFERLRSVYGVLTVSIQLTHG